MNTKIFLIFTFAAIILATAAWLFMGRNQNKFDKDIINRSKGYIQKMGSKELSELSLEQKLLLLHSYSNLKDYEDVVKIRKSLGAEFDQLPESRRKPFLVMIEEAYKHAGKAWKN